MGSTGSGAHHYLRFEKLPLEKGHKLHKYKVVNYGTESKELTYETIQQQINAR